MSASLRALAAILICAIAVYLLDKGLPWDYPIQSFFFDESCNATYANDCWTISKLDPVASFWLHRFPTLVFIPVGVIALFTFLFSFKYEQLKKYRVVTFGLASSLALCPGIVALLKDVTGHFCPSQLAYFKGVLGDANSPYQPSPRCYPAGHPSAGFAFIVLAFLPIALRWRVLGGVIGLVLGGTLSIIQFARGEHFLSHVAATMVIALTIGYCIGLLIRRQPRHFFNQNGFE